MLLTDETTALAQLAAAFGDGRGEYLHDGWRFTVADGRWLADPPPDCAPVWGEGPFTAANPIELAKICSEAETSQAITDMDEETREREAGQAAGREAAREARNREWTAFLATNPFLHPELAGGAGR